ncbi:hypothetical protein CC80DRAFT_390097, partial [Byssothecium circinans]
EALKQAFSLYPIPRFHHLFAHAKALIRVHGPYTTYAGTTVFTRAPIPRSTKTSKPPSLKTIATSFAAAQDSATSAQPAGPSKEDLQVFNLLWSTTIDILEQILEDGELGHEVFGWGVYGLAAGYIGEPESPLFVPRKSQAFESLKRRLRAALTALPSLSGAAGRTELERVKAGLGMMPAERIGQLVKARKETHICANLLMQRFRSEGWGGIRWGHVIAVVERWLQLLGKEDAVDVVE